MKCRDNSRVQRVYDTAKEEQRREEGSSTQIKLVFSKHSRSWVWVVGSQLFIMLSIYGWAGVAADPAFTLLVTFTWLGYDAKHT